MTKKLALLFLLSCAFAVGQQNPPLDELTQNAGQQAPMPATGMPFADVASFCAKYPATPGCPAAGAGETANGQEEQPGARVQAEPGNGVDGEPPEARPNQATARRPKSILVRSEFELFAEDAAGRPLPVYGRQLFDEGPTTFAPLDRVPVPEDFRYQVKRPVLAYLNDAGGATRDADVKRIFLVRADGEVISRQSHGGWQGNFEKISPLPGDAIVVPPRLKGPNPFLQMLPGMTQSLSQAAFQGAIQGLIP